MPDRCPLPPRTTTTATTTRATVSTNTQIFVLIRSQRTVLVEPILEDYIWKRRKMTGMAPPSNHPITTRPARFLPEYATTEIKQKSAAVAVLVDTREVFHPRPPPPCPTTAKPPAVVEAVPAIEAVPGVPGVPGVPPLRSTAVRTMDQWVLPFTVS